MKQVNSFNAEAIFIESTRTQSFLKTVGINWIALAEYAQKTTHMPGFKSFFF